MSHVAPSRSSRQGVVVAAVLIIFSIAALFASLQIEKDPGGGWGARIFPLFGSGTLLLVGILELRNSLFGRVPESKPASPSIWGLLGLALGYVWLIGAVGYLFSTALAAPEVKPDELPSNTESTIRITERWLRTCTAPPS